jgi:hypothetical protein
LGPSAMKQEEDDAFYNGVDWEALERRSDEE